MLGKYDVRQANVTGRVWGRKQIFRYYAEKNWGENLDIFFLTEYLRNPSSMNHAW